MKFGLVGINMGPCSTPGATTRVAQAAEAAGFESLWAGEHVVLPEPQVPPSPLPASFPMLDPTVAFAFIAGQTKAIRLGTGIIILPQRNPLVLAKELASLDVLSNGRLIFGVGIGYLKPEFDAWGFPLRTKDHGPLSICKRCGPSGVSRSQRITVSLSRSVACKRCPDRCRNRIRRLCSAGMTSLCPSPRGEPWQWVVRLCSGSRRDEKVPGWSARGPAEE